MSGRVIFSSALLLLLIACGHGPEDKSVESSIDAGTRPMNAATTPNGLIAEITCYFDDRVCLIDLATDTVVGFLEVGTRPNGVCLTSSGE